MILIIGGAYQGKLEFALKKFNLSESDVYRCSRNDIEFTHPVIYGLDEFVYGCTERGSEARDILASHRDQLEDKIIIACDVSCGVVPVDKTERAFREMMGRAMLYLSEESHAVYRVFCGLGQQLK